MEKLQKPKYGYHKNTQERTEEVQTILERMPTGFGWWVTVIIGLIALLITISGFSIRYPDVVIGQITVNTNIAPIKIVAASSGKLNLKVLKSAAKVKEGEVIAYIESTASPDTIDLIARIINSFNPLMDTNARVLSRLPSKVAIGEITAKYYTFLENLHQLKDFEDDKTYEKQISALSGMLSEQQNGIAATHHRLTIAQSNLLCVRKIYLRDSLLYTQRVLAEGDLDKSQLGYLSSQSNYQQTLESDINGQKEIKQTKAQIDQAFIQMHEKKNALQLSVLSSFNDLKDNINAWRQNYLFKAPFAGTVEFLGFWTSGQYIQNGQPVFSVIPKSNTVYGQVLLPSAGIGKVKIGQEVIIKLNNFPYAEFGYISGKVNAISSVPNSEKTQEGNVDSYLVTVSLNKGLTTNYGKILEFMNEAKGTAEIITNNRALIERCFDNLKYALNR